MTVYVDELVTYPRTRQWPYGEACHLVADSDAELHAFAARIGLQRVWLQATPKHSVSHYDLTRKWREMAVQAGAVEIRAKDFARKLIELRRAAEVCR